MNYGIDAIAFDVAKIHLPINTLANNRNIDPEKLEKGLGLLKMTLPDTHQDTVVFGANALTKLIVDNAIILEDISRIYVGTESAIDSSKPTASFLVSLMEQKFGANRLQECDVVDFTFACIGGVDAMQNCIDFVKLNPSKKAIVVTSDIAKYDLNSTGEYTQGAGAVAEKRQGHARAARRGHPGREPGAGGILRLEENGGRTGDLGRERQPGGQGRPDGGGCDRPLQRHRSRYVVAAAAAGFQYGAGSHGETRRGAQGRSQAHRGDGW